VDDYAAWRRTPIDFTINTFLRIQQGGTNPNFSISIMNACRAKLGRRCELGNHAISADMPTGNAQIGTVSPCRHDRVHPVEARCFGTGGLVVNGRAPGRNGCNATAIGLWPDAQFGGFTTLTMAQMRSLRGLFSGPAR
jgi:hypothetical protein